MNNHGDRSVLYDIVPCATLRRGGSDNQAATASLKLQCRCGMDEKGRDGQQELNILAMALVFRSVYRLYFKVFMERHM